MILAGDIGGTKTHLALFSRGPGRPRMENIRRFETSAYPEPAAMIETYLSENAVRVESACLAVAGPVTGGKSRLTNLPWTLSEERLARRFGWHRCMLLNDIEATVHALPLFKPSELHAVRRAQGRPQGNMGVLAPGTGLGAALAIQRGGTVIPMASEAGHANFAPIDEESWSLWRYMAGRDSYVSQEQVLSGQGLWRIYQWRRHLGDQHADPATGGLIEADDDPPARISALAMEARDPVCMKSLDCFIRHLGAAAGNLALTATAFGGVYLSGGIAPKLLPKLCDGVFEQAFLDKGRFRGMLRTVPVHVILLESAPVLGAAKRCLETAAGPIRQ